MVDDARDERYVHPAEGAGPRDIDREHTDGATVQAKQHERAVTHPQEPTGEQGLSSDSAGVNPADRDRLAEETGA